MSRKAILVFICLNVTYCSAATSKLTPKDFDKNLNGYPFCTYGNAEKLKALCVKLAERFDYSGYIESKLDNLQCDEFTIWLKDHAETAPWVSRTTYLLHCCFMWKDEETGESTKINKYLGDGFNMNDAFLYSPDSAGDITADGNLKDFIKGMF